MHRDDTTSKPKLLDIRLNPAAPNSRAPQPEFWTLRGMMAPSWPRVISDSLGPWPLKGPKPFWASDNAADGTCQKEWLP